MKTHIVFNAQTVIDHTDDSDLQRHIESCIAVIESYGFTISVEDKWPEGGSNEDQKMLASE